MSGLSGHLHVRASPRADGRTEIAEQSFRTPFHVGKGYWDGSALQVRVVNPTAGILAGDRLELDVRVDTGAALVVTTPAASRAFMMKAGQASCFQRFTVGDGAWLEYAPEPLFPHAGTDYAQETVVELAPGAETFFVESWAPGRAGSGERWSWRRLKLTLELRVGGQPRFRERMDLSGQEAEQLARFYRSPETWFATAILHSPRLTQPPIDPNPQFAPTRLGAGLWLIRILAPTGLALRDSLTELRTAAAAALPRLASNLRRV